MESLCSDELRAEVAFSFWQEYLTVRGGLAAGVVYYAGWTTPRAECTRSREPWECLHVAEGAPFQIRDTVPVLVPVRL